ncbi:MAG TPA: SRPBCC family protein [Solirubrobacteraceae bacterium]|nr:SRPBCC family protein [Solirubrobacteraceae bacterium]
MAPQPVTVTIDVPQPRQDVYAFLDVLANHEPFTDHMLVDWSLSGPDRGVGAKARVHSKAGGRKEPVDIEVIEAQPPVRSVERNVSAGGKRVGRGTYELTELPDGGTRVSFTYSWDRAPFSDRALAPLVRSILRRGNERAMERLASQLPAS